MIKRIVQTLSVLAVSIGLILPVSGSTPALAGDPPLVLAFYYAWYDQNTWTSGLSADQPSQPYISSEPKTIERHVSQAQAAGIDALVQSWYGPQETNNQTETNFRVLLDVAAAKGFHAAVDFETASPFFPDRESVIDALRHLLTVHAQHPGYLRFEGKPVIFFWRQQRYSVADWVEIRAQLDPGRNTLWIAEGVDISYQAVFDGHHLYSIAWSPDVEHTLTDWGSRVRRYESQNGADRLWVATTMPGYDDTRTDRADAFAVGRRSGDYYRETWAAALASQPDWVIITSFNEWVEGTMIEPSQGYGSLYLDLTHELATGFKSGRAESEPGEQQEQAATGTAPGPERQEADISAQIEPYVPVEQAVRVRSGPGTEYERIGQLYPGETAQVVGRNADTSWWQIEYPEADDRLGWVSADFVTFVGDSDSVPVAGDEPSAPPAAQSPTPIRATSTPAPTPTPAPGPTSTPVPGQTPVLTEPPKPTQTPAPTPTLQPTEVAPTAILITPTSTTIPTPTSTVTPVVSPSATPTATSTPMVRVTPVAHRRPVGLLWIGGVALIVAVGLGAVIFRTTRTSRKR